MDNILSTLGLSSLHKKFGLVKGLGLVDRLNCVVTVYIFIVFDIIILVPQFWGERRIRCWCPAEFTKDLQFEFFNDYCWTVGTYYVPEDELVPDDEQERQLRKVQYYQWVPLILLFQAFLFYFPKMLWVCLNSFTGLCFDQIVQEEKKLDESINDKTDSIVHLATILNRWLKFNHEHNRKQIYSVFMTALYLFIKVLFLTSAIAQFFILNNFLGKNYSLLGLEILKQMTSNEANWKGLTLFPPATLCDLRFYQLQNVQTWTVQCVLPYNLLYEKFYIFIWFWMTIVATATCMDLGMWLYRMTLRQKRVAYVKKYLEVSGIKVNDNRDGTKYFSKFVQYLGVDGVFVLRVIGNNFNDPHMTHLVLEMWKLYEQGREEKLLEKDNLGC